MPLRMLPLQMPLRMRLAAPPIACLRPRSNAAASALAAPVSTAQIALDCSRLSILKLRARASQRH
eukprot:4818045-Pleurochrysis_carterae.AAC.1